MGHNSLKHSVILHKAQNQVPQEAEHSIQRWKLGNICKTGGSVVGGTENSGKAEA